MAFHGNVANVGSGGGQNKDHVLQALGGRIDEFFRNQMEVLTFWTFCTFEI